MVGENRPGRVRGSFIEEVWCKLDCEELVDLGPKKEDGQFLTRAT